MASPPVFSPSSDKRFWSTLRSRIDNLLENRKPIDAWLPAQNGGATEGATRLKEDSMLLLRGFDSVAHTLSQMSNNLENALQGARDLARPPTMTEILQCTLEKAKNEEPPAKREDEDDDEEAEAEDKEGKRRLKRKFSLQECFEDQADDPKKDRVKREDEEAEAEDKEGKRGLKRKFSPQECFEDQADDPKKDRVKSLKDLGKLNKAKNLAISMATKAAAMARELKSIKSDLCFMQERCTLLEEENKRLRDGLEKGIRPEEDDLVRLQLEALLAEKSRLANENANLTRENRCLHQLVEYHQLTSQDLSASYENLITGMCLDFSSSTTSLPEEDQDNGNGSESEAPQTPPADILGFCKSLDECYEEH